MPTPLCRFANAANRGEAGAWLSPNSRLISLAREQVRHQIIEVRRRNQLAEVVEHERPLRLHAFLDLALGNSNLLACRIREHQYFPLLRALQSDNVRPIF